MSITIIPQPKLHIAYKSTPKSVAARFSCSNQTPPMLQSVDSAQTVPLQKTAQGLSPAKINVTSVAQKPIALSYTQAFCGTPAVQKFAQKITDKEFFGAKLYTDNNKIAAEKLGWKRLSAEQIDLSKASYKEYLAFQHALALAEMNDSPLVQKYNPNVVTKPLATYNLLCTPEAKKEFVENIKTLNMEIDNKTLDTPLLEKRTLNVGLVEDASTSRVFRLNPEVLIQRIHPYLGMDKSLNEQHKFIFGKDMYKNVIEKPEERANRNMLKYAIYYLNKNRKDRKIPLTLKDVLFFQNGQVPNNIKLKLDEDGCNAAVSFNRSYVLQVMDLSNSPTKQLKWCKNILPTDVKSGNDIADFGVAQKVMKEDALKTA